ncbi:MAG TPA: fructosamine kinase family protein [Kofleriaceae bacterium]|nr:fructosamine kinase family protein [Kofleriaceae bacterium]
MRVEIGAALGTTITHLRAVGGGDINDAYAATTADGRTVFVKHNDGAPDGMFDAEADGLAWLAEARAIRIPKTLAIGRDFLVLEWLEPSARPRGFDEALGRGLAMLHRFGATANGHTRDNFIATIPQDNRDAPRFYLERRLLPLIDRAIATRGAPTLWRDQARALEIPDEPPARLHGDLWSGNVHCSDGGPVLIDPAVYGGHREIDLAMLALFGGLSDAVARAYDEVHPLEPSWRERVPIWQLYPLLVHTILFGGGYGAQVDSILRRFC